MPEFTLNFKKNDEGKPAFALKVSLPDGSEVDAEVVDGDISLHWKGEMETVQSVLKYLHELGPGFWKNLPGAP